MNESLLVQDKKKKVCLVQYNVWFCQEILFQPFSKKTIFLQKIMLPGANPIPKRTLVPNNACELFWNENNFEWMIH
jgi:hypothetical protein